MGNLQFLPGPYTLNNSRTDLTSPATSFTMDSDCDFSINDHSAATTSRSNKIVCEYCQEYSLEHFHEQHVRICPCNPINLRGEPGLRSYRAVEPPQVSSKCELDKTVCEFCNERCFTKFLCNHKRICAKNPENVKISCRYCNRTFNLIMYQNHLRSCEDTQGQRRRSVDAHGSRRGHPELLSNLRRVKTNNDIEVDDFERKPCPIVPVKDHQAECSICLEVINSRFELKTLRCSHQYHKKCIDSWSIRQSKCPICRRNFF